MLYIALSILCSAILIIIFKFFEKYNIDIFQGILFNYFTCVTCAWLSLGHFPIPSDLPSKEWFPFALVLGFCFITGFNAVGGTVKNFNMALASVMQKMSLLFAVAFTIIYYKEALTWNKSLGIIAAIGAILLTSFSSDTNEDEGDKQKHSLRNWLLFPFTAWILSGVIDVLLYYVNNDINKGKSDISFIATLFATAALFGSLAFVRGLSKGTMKFQLKNVIGGICLGIPNFLSIYFLLESFNQGYDGSVVFPVTNVGIILISTFSGVLFFHEALGRRKVYGIVLAILAIALIAMK
jgi:drug/metabolite transporter (DMT)-like permease